MKTAVVVTISDKGSRNERIDTAGPAVQKIISEAGFSVIHTEIIPDEKNRIEKSLIYAADQLEASLIFTVGGTGFSPRDVTPEATLAVCERLTPGIPEAMRIAGSQITNRAMLSRSVAGIRRNSLIINLPGSEKAAKENLNAVIGSLGHATDMLLKLKDECAADNQ